MKLPVAGPGLSQAAAARAATFEQAVLLHRQGRPFQAEAVCAEVLRADPRHCGAWHLRGLLALEGGNVDQGIEWISRSLRLDPGQAAAHANLGNAYLSARKPRKALASLECALRLKPDYVAALYNRGNALRELRLFEEALASYERVLRNRADHVPALNNRGLTLAELGRSEEALASFERAAGLDPRFADAGRNLGAMLLKLGRRDEALECYDRLVRAPDNPPDPEAWCGRGNALLALKRPEEALESYSHALRIDPARVDALINRGTALQSLQRPADALEDYERALALAPDSVLALNNSGNALLELGRADTALARYDRALGLSCDAADTWYNRGAALRELRRYAESARSFEEVLRLAPGRDYALGNLFHLRMDCCDWHDYESLSRQLLEALGRHKRVANPMPLLLLPCERDLPLECARAYVEANHPSRPTAERCPRTGQRETGRIRVAYVSGDFREHPVSYLLAGTLERHDRAAFEIVGVSLREAEKTELGRRVRSAFDSWVEAEGRSDLDVAELLRERQVDIAVDLMGFTQGMRLGIFARRAAPVQVVYLGYAGTLGAPFIDYLIADEVVIPQGEERDYAEQIVRLPHCYLPNDDRRPIAADTPSRSAAGLPEGGLVFCAFTNSYKINPPMFDIWMRLLRSSPDSVLWLRSMAQDACANLRREADARGISPERLIFAPYAADMTAHLARLGLADLYLDTLPYNAHSTACDALWAGLPVLTCAGSSMASRTAASALIAAGLPELVTHSLEDYGRKALALAQDPVELQRLRARLASGRRSAPLFDTERHTRHLEAAYRTMHQRAMRGEPPLAFKIEPIVERC